MDFMQECWGAKEQMLTDTSGTAIQTRPIGTSIATIHTSTVALTAAKFLIS